MKPTSRILGLALAAAASFASATETSAIATVPATNAAAPATIAIPRFATKGPVLIGVTYFGERDKKMDELRIVRRSTVVGTNVANVALGVSLALLGAPTPISGHGKEDFYGDEITDERDSARLANPLQSELQSLLDQKITELVAAENEDSDTPLPKYKNMLSITPQGWNLLYHELNADKEHEDQYVLRFAAAFSKTLEGEEDRFMHKARKIERNCAYVSKPQALAVWQQNDYEAVAAEQKLATQACLDQVVPYLPGFLGIDSTSKIKAAQLNCKTGFKQCVAGADTAAEPGEAKKLCKTEYNQCVSTDVKPMISMTPIGQCKDSFASCKATVLDKARATNPGEKPAKSEFVPCSTEYKACVAAAR